MAQYVFYELPDGTQQAMEAAYFLPPNAKIIAVFGEFVRQGDVIVCTSTPSADFGHISANISFPQDAFALALIRDKRVVTCLGGFEDFVTDYARSHNLIIAEETF